MRSNTEIYHGNILGLFILVTGLFTSVAHAKPLDCSQASTSSSLKKVCSERFVVVRSDLSNKILTAYLISDAPTHLLQDSQQLWLQRLQQCKNNPCVQQQFEQRLDDLNVYTSLNQSLTQHYLKFEQGHIAKQPVHLKIHQLSKDRIKIEGIAYRSPNNRKETQTIAFLAYTTPEQKQNITDNEHDCKYQFEFQKALLTIKTQQKGCERFTGFYRLYD